MVVINEIEELADAIFNVIPEWIQKKFEKDVFGNRLSLKDQFIADCHIFKKMPRHSKDVSVIIVERIIRDNDFEKKKNFDLSVFDCLTRKNYDLVEQKRFIYREACFEKLEIKLSKSFRPKVSDR